MDKEKIAKVALESSGGIAKTAEFIVAGLSKWDVELFIKAVHAYVADDRKNLSNLSRYA